MDEIPTAKISLLQRRKGNSDITQAAFMCATVVKHDSLHCLEVTLWIAIWNSSIFKKVFKDYSYQQLSVATKPKDYCKPKEV